MLWRTTSLLYRSIKPLLFRLDPERAHELVAGLLRVGARLPFQTQLLQAIQSFEDPLLAVECAGLQLPNPIGLAAGFDKRAACVGPLGMLGFGHVEVGTVTPRPQPGNERPRLFRLPQEQALINRMGFNSPGMVEVARQLRRRPDTIIVGVNLGKNRSTPLERAVEDYRATFIALAPFADYIAINISSPNTPGLRRLHERSALEQLLAEIGALNRRLAQPRPLFLKVSPDEPPSQLDEVVRAGCDAQIAGFIAVNTTLDRTGIHSPLRCEEGGLSGRPLAERARQTIGRIYSQTGGSPAVIGVGGIASAGDVYACIRQGATLVQLYTAMIYQGPAVVYAIKHELIRLLRQDGYRSVTEAIGVDRQ